VLTLELVRQVNGSIEVHDASPAVPFRIHLAELEQLQVVRGRARPKGTAFGAIGGGLIGILGGMVCQAACAENAQGKRYEAPLAGFVIGAAAGAVVGAILAPPRWLNVRLR
jgi:hypothetical protein